MQKYIIECFFRLKMNIWLLLVIFYQCLFNFIINDEINSTFKFLFDLAVLQYNRKPNMTSHKQINLKKSTHSQTIDSLGYQEHSVLEKYGKYVYRPENHKGNRQDNETANEKIMQWALANQIEHYSFLSFPYNSTVCEKQESLLDLKYIYKKGLQGQPRLYLSPDLLLKGEADGSSFPSGGLRQTHRARAYNIWDQNSQIFIRRKNKVMYIPSLLIAHNGQALDDMTLFRKSQAMMKKAASQMLNKLQVKHQEVLICLGLEQEFFVIPKEQYLLRTDLRHTGRTLVGNVGAKSQQFSDHYYGKMPVKIEEIIKEIQNQLLEIGIPFKTKHNEVANNQFQFCTIYEDAGKSITHNLITMEILKQTFDRHGYTVLLHEKPFKELNGSGKHANWSINYVDQMGNIQNMFSVPKKEDDKKLFKLFVLLNLMAIRRNNALYFAAIAPSGNQIRLGGHQAPPRIISAYLGQAVSSIIDGKDAPEKLNLKDEVFSLVEDVYQQDTDRNRTSPYAYTGHKFQFRALGSSQNPAFPMAVITATLAKQFQLATKKLSQGMSIGQLIQELRIQSYSVRFQGNGYSQEWPKQAKQKNLYVNEQFYQILQRMEKECQVFVEVGACSQRQISAKCQVAKQNYIKVCETQGRALIQIAEKNIIPRGYKYLQTLNVGVSSKSIKKYSENFNSAFQSSLQYIQQLESMLQKSSTLKQASEIRKRLSLCGEKLSSVLKMLEKDPKFPDLQDFLLL